MATQNSSAAAIEAAGRDLFGLVAQAQSLNKVYRLLDSQADSEAAFACLADDVLERLAASVDDYVTAVSRHLQQGAA